VRGDGKLNILLVDDQPAKLLTYDAILADIGENLIKATSGREALEHLLKSEIAVVLMDVCMPELDGFQLASMIRDHPRFHNTAIIFISAIHLTDVDRLRGYEMGAVDYVPIPVIPEVLRAKVKIFVELYRKSQQLEELNAVLEQRVAERTAELEQSNRRLQESEDRRNLALAAGRMGSWDWDLVHGDCVWDDGQKLIFGVDAAYQVTPESLRQLVHPLDRKLFRRTLRQARRDAESYQIEFRICRPDGSIHWCLGTAAASRDAANRISRISGVTIDITDRKETEERQSLLAREVDHRAKNALAVVHAIVRLTRADNIKQFATAVEGRIQALARAHSLIAESRWRGANLHQLVQDELAPYRTAACERVRITGKSLSLEPSTAQALGLAVHELATNAAKYGSLSSPSGEANVSWELKDGRLELRWTEHGGPLIKRAVTTGFGIRVIKASIETQLNGTVELDWHRSGLCCTISVPHQMRFDLPEPNQQAATKAEPPLGTMPPRIRKRILLVEDETLIAMMMAQALDDLGFDVVGPFGKVADTFAAIEHESVDGAILDINLGTEMVYPVATLLQARKVPFVFMTGYGSDMAAGAFPEVTTFQKPIERDTLAKLFASSDATENAASHTHAVG
jgi:PAS domain S-box-containing protein